MDVVSGEISFCKTECKYTKSFFSGKWFYKNNFKSFTTFAHIKLSSCFTEILNLY